MIARFLKILKADIFFSINYF